MSHYKIGQLTKTMGVSSHLLKHYEKFGLIYPHKDEETNYRYYEFRQFGRLIQSKKYRNIGLSIKDTSDIVNSYDNESLNQHIKHHIKTLEQEISQLVIQKELTEQLYRESLQCDENLNQWYIEMMPTYYILKQSNNKELIEENHSIVNNQINLIDHLPLTESLIYMPQSNLTNSQFTYHWCLGIQEKFSINLGLTLDKRFLTFPQHRAFVTYLKLPTPYTNNQLLIKTIKSLFDHYPFTCCGDLIGILIKTTQEEGKTFHYFKVYVPIE